MVSGPQDPDTSRQIAQQLFDRGLAAEESGAIEEARQFYRDALSADPRFAEAHFNLGLNWLQTGDFAQAESGFRAALELRDDFPEAWVGLAEVLETVGRDTESLAALDTAIGQRPHYAGALFNASLLLRKMGKPDEAESRLQKIDLMLPFSAGHYAEAEALSRQVTLAWPGYGFGWKVLGAVLATQKRFEEAVPAFRRALTIMPTDAETHHNLAIALHALAQFPGAEESYRRAIELKPEYHEAHNNLGNLLHTLGRLGEAEASCRRALQLNPDYFEAHGDLGNVLEALGRPSEALASHRRALALKPEYHMAHANLGAALFTLGRIAEAEASCRRAIELNPDFRSGYDNLLFLLNYHPDRSPAEILGAYREYDVRFGQPLRSEWRAHDNSRKPDKKLRVGYVSPDFRRHPTRHFFEPLLDHHDRSRFEVFIYSEVAIEDDVTRRMRLRADHWLSTCGIEDAKMADRIRADGIDILVDLAGHSRGNRLPVFARKPSPVSATTTFGFGYTTGLSAIDWFLTDSIVVPDGAESMFSEQPWRIPLCQVFRPDEDTGPVNELPALKRGLITFGTLTRAARINHRVVRLWSEILHRVAGSRLRIDSLNFRDTGLCDALAAQFAAHGIDRDRVEMGFQSPPWDVLRGIDICLDCFPQNSGTTLFESLYMGIPFVTLADRPPLGRLGASIATSVGHPEWVAASETQYSDKVTGLAQDLPRLACLRADLRAQTQASPLMDEIGYVRQVETAYREMWRRWCKG